MTFFINILLQNTQFFGFTFFVYCVGGFGMPVVNSAQNLTKKEIVRGRNIYREVAKRTQQNVKFGLLENIADTPISETYLQKREQLLNSFSKFGVQDVALKQIKSANTLRALFGAIIDFPKTLVSKTFPKFPFPKKQSIPIQMEQVAYKYRNLRAACVREINTVFSKKSTHPVVVQIENILKEKYGVKTALLNNDLILAEEVLKAVELAKYKGVKIPDEFITTHFTLGAGECLRLFKDNKEVTTVLLPHSDTRGLYMFEKSNLSDKMPHSYLQILDRWKNFCGFKENSSTSSPLHVEIHEMMHQTHIPLTPFSIKKIPSKFLPTVRKLSGYAAVNEKNNYEIYTELATKKILSKLEPEEAELFKFLGGDI